MKTYKLGAQIPALDNVNTLSPLSGKELDIERMSVHRCYIGITDDKIPSYYTGIEDCTSVAIADGLNVLSYKRYKTNSSIQVKDVINFYSETTGYNPANPLTDRGGDPTKVLWFLENEGFTSHFHPFKTDSYDYTYHGFSGVIPKDDSYNFKIAKAIETFGFVYACLNLLECDETIALNNTEVFTLSSDKKKWVWGGHVVALIGYVGLLPQDWVYFISWGKIRKATWEWFYSRSVVSFGIIFRYLTFKNDEDFVLYLKQWKNLSIEGNMNG